MTNWTPAARQELERYFTRLGPWLKATGADPAEVIDDLRQHLAREVETARLEVVTETDVRRLLARIGAPEPELPPQAPSPPSPPPPLPPASGGATPPAGQRPRPGFWLLAGGVVLPLITFLVEVTTRMCSAVFFDPMPTWGHVALILLVPLANAFAWQAARSGNDLRLRALAWANAVAVGVAIFYAILYLPLMFPGLFAMMFFGWGLLPWSPLLALIATLILRRHLRRLGGTRPLPPGWKGVTAAWAALLVLAAPDWITRVGLDYAKSPEPAQRNRGLSLLRTLGSHDTMLRACYGRTRGAANMDLAGLFLTGGKDVSPEAARQIYYRVYGRPFNSVPAPAVRTARGRFAALEDWTWDVDQAGEAVGGRIKGLYLVSSQLDAVADAAGAWGYTEWILEFENQADRQREARAQILLPPGGVVSRLTLWVNGEEREAAFAGRAATRQAYTAVVARRRDPVLVTTAGPDRVLMQCFPVPPNGGRMKVRIGITAPLLLNRADQGRFVWPHFVERNFTIPESLRHTTWLEVDHCPGAASDSLAVERLKPVVQAARGELDDPGLAAPGSQVTLRRDPEATFAWTTDERTLGADRVIQRLVETNLPPSRHLVLALDTSAAMKDAWEGVLAALAEQPADARWQVVLAGDESAEVLREERSQTPLSREALLARLRQTRLTGGRDMLPALVEAWDLAAAQPDGVVVWVHAAQPIVLGDVAPLRQRHQRRPHGPRIFALQVQPGPNKLLEEFDTWTGIRNVPALNGPQSDLAGLLARLTAGAPFIEARRERVPADAADVPEAARTGSHLARLWARTAVEKLRVARKNAQARDLAARFQLVTPVSGAVVLENQRQYDNAGLQPVNPETVPSIPEPATRTLLLLGAALLLAARRARPGRRGCPRVFAARGHSCPPVKPVLRTPG